MKTNQIRLLTSVVLLVATALLANATPAPQPINVPNASFESPGPGQSSTNDNLVPGWVFDMPTQSAFGIGSISSNFSSAGASAGNQYVYLNNDYPGVTNTLTSAASLGPITANTIYTLTVAVGNKNQGDNSLYGAPGNVTFSLLADGVPFATQEVANGTVPNGTFDDFSLTYSVGASAPIIGENLEIQMATLPEQGTAYQPAFDNVTLSSLDPPAAPEPASSVLLVAGILTLVWWQRRTLSSGRVSVPVAPSRPGA